MGRPGNEATIENGVLYQKQNFLFAISNKYHAWSNTLTSLVPRPFVGETNSLGMRLHPYRYSAAGNDARGFPFELSMQTYLEV